MDFRHTIHIFHGIIFQKIKTPFFQQFFFNLSALWPVELVIVSTPLSMFAHRSIFTACYIDHDIGHQNIKNYHWQLCNHIILKTGKRILIFFNFLNFDFIILDQCVFSSSSWVLYDILVMMTVCWTLACFMISELLLNMVMPHFLYTDSVSELEVFFILFW